MIRLAPELELPESAVTNSYALLAMKGAGKSNAAVVFAEQLFASGIPWVCIDPKGDWWGIRSGAGGRGKGLPVPIFGGVHADVPIDPQAGKLFADLVVDQHLTCLIDTSELTKGESVRFLRAFFDQLYRRKNRSTYPLHLFLEEADDYVPQKVYGEIAPLVRTVELVVKRGRQRGLGITLASQRSASINKDVLTQTDTLIALRTTSPQDRKAIKAWLDYHAGAQEIIDELPTLHDGEAWVSSPAQLRILKRIKFDRRTTFDSGATPELGEKVKPATLADIDIAAITAAVGDLVEKAKADDPRTLRTEIVRLTKALDQAQRGRVDEPRTVEVEVVREVIPSELADTLEVVIREAAPMLLDGLVDELRSALIQIADALPPTQHADRATPAPIAREQRAPRSAPVSSSARHLGKREHAILTVLAQHDNVGMRKLALLTGYSRKASTIGAGLSTLRKAGFVEGMQITDSGRAELGELEPLPTGNELLHYWRGQLGKREKAILDVLEEAWPESVTQFELAERCGYSATASTIGAGLSKLRGLGIVDGQRLSSDFAETIA